MKKNRQCLKNGAPIPLNSLKNLKMRNKKTDKSKSKVKKFLSCLIIFFIIFFVILIISLIFVIKIYSSDIMLSPSLPDYASSFPTTSPEVQQKTEFILMFLAVISFVVMLIIAFLIFYFMLRG